MTIFCKKCGAKLTSELRFCTQCGTPISSTPPAPATAPLQTTKKSLQMAQSSSNGGNTQKWMIVALIALVAGSGGWYLWTTQKGGAHNPSTPTESTLPAVTPPPVNPPSTSGVQNILQEAEMELNQYGITYHINATSYGHSSDGFLALADNEGVLLIVDRKNHQAAEVTPKNMNLNKFRNMRNESYQHPIIVEFKIPNAIHDGDSEHGTWTGNTHIFPIYCQYKFDALGNVVPGMLTSGKGKNPSHYQGPLYEQRSVDLANLFLREAIPLCEDMDRRK